MWKFTKQEYIIYTCLNCILHIQMLCPPFFGFVLVLTPTRSLLGGILVYPVMTVGRRKWRAQWDDCWVRCSGCLSPVKVIASTCDRNRCDRYCLHLYVPICQTRSLLVHTLQDLKSSRTYIEVFWYKLYSLFSILQSSIG